jgi:hypothetical protein
MADPPETTWLVLDSSGALAEVHLPLGLAERRKLVRTSGVVTPVTT